MGNSLLRSQYSGDRGRRTTVNLRPVWATKLDTNKDKIKEKRYSLVSRILA